MDQNNSVPDKLNEIDLPSTIQGDGRYLISLLENYLRELGSSINTMNGHDDEENITENNIPTPKNFIISFDNGIYKASWNKVKLYDGQELDSYELRTNTKTDTYDGYLEKTNSLESFINPNYRTGTVFLYTRLKNGLYSLPNFSSYNKPVPIPPTYINVTQTENGQLITFSQIPKDCIGAVIKINNTPIKVNDNSYLYSGYHKITSLKVCYYDIFGEGRYNDLYSHLDNVESFIVERVNDTLNFTWDSIQAPNIKYQIRKSEDNEKASWESSEYVFEISANKHTIQFPNNGKYIFWIKAIDQFGSESEIPTFYRINTEPITLPNIVEKYNQNKLAWDGNKFNLNYDSDIGMAYTNQGTSYSEFIQKIELPDHERQDKDDPYLARNWVEYNVFSVNDDSLMTWDQANFQWESDESYYSNWIGKVIDYPHKVKHQIATKKEEKIDNLIDYFKFDNNLNGINGTISTNSTDINYDFGRYGNGIFLDETDFVEWDVNLPKSWGIIFNMKKTKDEKDTYGISFKIENNDGSEWWKIKSNNKSNKIELINSNNDKIETPIDFHFRDDDMLQIGLSSSENGDFSLFIYSTATNYSFYSEANGKNIKNLNKIRVGALK